MFKKKHQEDRRRRKKSLGVLGIFRLILSLIMLLILSVGIYQAYRSFSGVDPLKLNPASIINQMLSSQSAVDLVDHVFTFDPTSPLTKFLPGFLKPGRSPIIPTDQDKSNSLTLSQPTKNPPSIPKSTPPPPQLDFKFALMADSEDDNQDLSKAITQAKDLKVNFILDLGDLSQVGTVSELSAVKLLFDQSKLPYYIIPGDHDFWDSRNRGLPPASDFNSVFGPNYHSLVYQTTGFVMVDNSDNYDGISNVQQQWVKQQLQTMKDNKLKTIFVFSGTPFYHPSSDHVMGKVTPSLKIQADAMINLFAQYQVTEVMAGDAHLYSEYTEPKTGLKMMTVGAITADRNLESPRFAIVDVYSDGSYNIEDTEIK